MGLTAGAWIAIAAIAVSAAGTGVTLYAASEAAAQRRKEAELAEEMRLQEAQEQLDLAAYEERQFRRRMSILLGKNFAITAGTGLDPESGTPLYGEIENVTQAELEALNIRRTGQVGESASKFEARLNRYRASLYGQQRTMGMLAAGTQGAGSILSTWATSAGATRRSRTPEYTAPAYTEYNE